MGIRGSEMLLFRQILCMYLMDGPLRCVTHIIFFERKSDRKKSFFVLVIGAYFSLKSTNFKTHLKRKQTLKRI